MSARRTIAALLLVAVALALSLPAGPAAAEEDACTDGYVPAGVSMKLPAFLFEQSVTVAGSVPDAFVWAQYVEIPGEVRDNAFLGGQKINVEGTIGGDLFAFAQTIMITGEVHGDVWAWGGEVVVAPGARVGGNLLSGCGMIEIDGRLEGVLKGGCGQVKIDGTLADGGDIEAGSLRIGPDAVIQGRLQYESPEPAEIDPAAVIEGELVFRQAPPAGADGDSEGEEEAGGFSFWSLLKAAWFYVAGLLVGLVLIGLARTHVLRPSALLRRSPGKVLGVGFITLIVVPIGAVIAIALLLTMPLGFIGLALYAVAFYLAMLVASLWLGGQMLAWLGKGFTLGFGALALGLLAFQILAFIPYLGFLIKWLAVIAGLGGITLVLMNRDGEAPAAA